MNPRIDAFLKEEPKWRKEMEQLRAIALDCGLDEELKWGKPCYSVEGSNQVILQGFKDTCALLFCKGALLRDPKGILEKPGANTHEARRVLFTDVGQVVALKPVLKAYILEAIAAEKAGLKVPARREPEPVPEELKRKLAAAPALKAAFQALTPGRQRAYLLYFSAARQSATRESRIDKCAPRILSGKGLND